MFDIFSKDGLISFLYMLPALLISLSIHELAHSFVAYKLGDKSQKLQGRLTLDPFAHIDWFGFISIALIGIGWGKPVIVNDSNFKNRSRDNMLVSFAGPFSNLLMAILVTVVLKILLITSVLSKGSTGVAGIVLNMLILTIQFNVIFAVFNMLPIPPFDGSKVLMYFIPAKYHDVIYRIEPYSFLIILALFFTGAFSYIISPIVNFIYKLLMLII